VDMFAMFHCGRPDILPVGDLAVRKGFQALYALPAPPSVEEMEALAEPWRPFRSLGRRAPARSRRRGCLPPATARLRGAWGRTTAAVGGMQHTPSVCAGLLQCMLRSAGLSTYLRAIAPPLHYAVMPNRVCARRSYFMWKVPAAPKAPRTPKKAPKAKRAGAAAVAEVAAAAEVGGATAIAVAAAAAAVTS